MMGLYPPGEGAALKLSSKQVAALASGKGMPPMSIRNTAKINTDLGFSALPFDFVSVPIATYMTSTMEDELSSGACKYVSKTTSARDSSSDDDLYSDYWFIADAAKQPLADALEIDYAEIAGATFHDVYHYADAYISR